MIDISGLDKAEVLIALYENAKTQGLGIFSAAARGPEPITKDEAAAMLLEGTYLDYVYGRVMKVELSGDTLDPRLYDRDNGQGAQRDSDIHEQHFRGCADSVAHGPIDRGDLHGPQEDGVVWARLDHLLFELLGN